jgi:hypothetical protein
MGFKLQMAEKLNNNSEEGYKKSKQQDVCSSKRQMSKLERKKD